MANFSTSSRLDSIVANLVPETITQVTNILFKLGIKAEDLDKDHYFISFRERGKGTIK